MSARYALPAVLVHWLTAILVVALIVLGRYMVDLPRGPSRGETFALHKSLGMTVFLLTMFRLAWRFNHPPPSYPGGVDRWQVAAARAIHGLFYLALLVQPLSGYLSSSFSGYKSRFFGIPLPHWGHRDESLNELFTGIHVACSVFLMILIAVHVVGALSHLARRDGLFSRMVPRPTRWAARGEIATDNESG